MTPFFLAHLTQILSIFYWFFSLIFKFEKQQQPCLMAVSVGVIIHGLKENYICIVPLKSSPLKPLCQMNRNLVGCIYGRSSIKTAHFVPIHLQIWLLQTILVSDWSISKNILLWNCLNRPIRNKNCLWWPCLLTDQNGMRISHRGPSIDASYHASVHLHKLFQSRRFLEIE
jgi:hypothetical protein